MDERPRHPGSGPAEGPPTDAAGAARRGRGDDARRRDEEARLGWKMAGIGFEVASEVAAGVIVGVAIDYFAGTGNRWTIICGITGLVVAMITFVRRTLLLNRQLEKSTRHRRLPGPISEKEWERMDAEEQGKE